jgi:hypothetical protein
VPRTATALPRIQIGATRLVVLEEDLANFSIKK